uniref:Taste receptor type 2 n=1 Tax=Pyxicephalus adspersus TaxID=30357 RepID=A0AAV3AE07_PYXAD|nr:TPA: hypothetical protein GDO54_009869 [Pyxicephalus adspersus]
MASFTLENFNIYDLSLFVGVGFLCLVGLMIHSFIASVSVMDWLKKRQMNAVDQVITALSVFRVLFQVSNMTRMLLKLFNQRTLIIRILLGWSTFSLIMTSYCNIYLSALLSAVFCFKVCSFHNVIFQCLKKLIVQRLGCVIVASMLVSLLLGSFVIYELILDQYSNVTNERIETRYTYYATIVNFVPFFVQVFSSISLIVFLHLHLRKMKSTSNLNVQLDPIYHVLKGIAFCFLTYFVQILCDLLTAYFYTSLSTIVAFIIWNACPCVHSIYLIRTTTRLRNHFSRIPCWGTNSLFKRRAP